MNKVKRDPFWDGSSGGVRCSSDGENSSKYLDPATQTLESSGRSIASLMPSSSGLRGVIIPRATVLGGSSGFDSNKPRLVNIDPDVKGQSCVVDLGLITEESMNAAFNEASSNPLVQNNLQLRAAQTYHNLAIGYEPVGMTKSVNNITSNRLSPLGGSAYVVPKAKLGGGQEPEEIFQQQTDDVPQQLMSPSVQPRNVIPTPINRPIMQKVAEVEDAQGLADSQDEAFNTFMSHPTKPSLPTYRDQTARHVKPATQPLKKITPPTQMIISPPATKVTFEMAQWGTFEAMYHEVIRNDCLLVLVYNTKFKDGMKFMPQATEQPLAVKIDGSDKVYFVYSYGNKFEHAGYEYCILVIDQEANSENE